MTTLSLSLPPETEAKLRAWAVAAGKDPAGLALEALEEKLAVLDDVEDRDGQGGLSNEQWVARLRRWADGHRRLPFEADDSRDTIYEGRGE